MAGSGLFPWDGESMKTDTPQKTAEPPAESSPFGQGGIRGNPPVSVVVPVYNVRAHLDRCVKSVLGQTFRDFEVILVDDGSTDGSGERCDEWALRDSRIRVFHQSNAGQAVARNRAVAQCAGTWVAFVDADDFVAPEYVEYLIRLVQDHGADLSSCALQETDIDRLPPPSADKVAVWEPSEACIHLLRGEGLMDGPVCKLFRRSALLACPFPEGRVYEDTAVMGRLVYSSARVAVGARVLYGYFRHPGSTTHSPDLKKRRDQLWAEREAAKFFDEVGYREAAQLAWDNLKKMVLADIKNKVLPIGELRDFWGQNRGGLASWNALGVKCRIALAAPWFYRFWGRMFPR
jgi:glycosyltransferase involved in cell wall biosynthesis